MEYLVKEVVENSIPITTNVRSTGNESNLNEENIRNGCNDFSKVDIECGVQTDDINESANASGRMDLNNRHGSLKHQWKHTLEPIIARVALDTTGSKFISEHSARRLSIESFLQQAKTPRRTFSSESLSDIICIGNEKLPNLNLYRDLTCDLQRPTLFQLRQDKELHSPKDGEVLPALAQELTNNVHEENATSFPEKKGAVKFGWKEGVFLRDVQNILGVMLFLRMSWMAGQAGIGYSTLIVAISVLVTSLTSMSMSALCTNGEVKGGGTYYVISRSLGPEFGGSIGIVFSIANAVAAAMHILGFAETVSDIMWENDARITGDQIHDVRVISIITCCLCVTVIFIGMEWESKAQIIFLVIMAAALINYYVGTILPPTDEQKWIGFVGYKAELFVVNFLPHFTPDYDFFKVFAIFFPSATGILAGANMSGDLKNPSTAIPKGTFLAILCSTIVYLSVIWTSGSCMVISAIGALTESELVKEVTDNVTYRYSPDFDLVQECWRFNKTCKGGLLYETGLIGLASGWRPLIISGIISATLSSALVSMVSAPKVFQALCKDNLFPYIHFFGKDYGNNGEPKRAYVLCFVIAAVIVCIGSLNAVAPIISNFFLMSYALINFACFDASVANSPSFRPGFKYYNKWLSLLGSILCVGSMFLMNWWAALITIMIVAGLYTYVHRAKPDVNWGSSSQASVYNSAIRSTLKLVRIEDHVKTFRPQILLLSGYPRNRVNLVDFAATITKKQSLLICGHILQGDIESFSTKLQSRAVYKWFEDHKINSFYNTVCAPTFRVGAQVLLQTLGIGKLRPNILMLGYKCNWLNAEVADVLDYFNVIQDAFDLHFGVGILRVRGGFDKSNLPEDFSDIHNTDTHDWDEEIPENGYVKTKTINSKSSSIQSNLSTDAFTTAIKIGQHGEAIILKNVDNVDGKDNAAFEGDNTTRRQKQISISMEEQSAPFRKKHHGIIDVWWLYDDGGLTLLIPFILRQRKQWKNCKLRIFFLDTGKTGNEAEAKNSMTLLLSKFRIEYSEMTIITDLNHKPQLSTYNEFENIIHDWRLKPNESPEDCPWKISDSNLLDHKKKTYRKMRLREKLFEHSKCASLIVMTLPVPRKSCPAALYMGFLEMLTRGMPPILLLRGDQQNVLTFLS